MHSKSYPASSPPKINFLRRSDDSSVGRSSSESLEIIESTLSYQHMKTLQQTQSRLEMATFRFPQSDLRPTVGINMWESTAELKKTDEDPHLPWLYPQIDWEAENRFGHLSLKIFALIARVAVVIYWIVTDLPGMDNWLVQCLFYHAGPGLLGVETSAIMPYIFSPVPFRTVSWFHDIMALVVGSTTILAIYTLCEFQHVVLTLLTLTIIPLFVDLIIHIATLPKHVTPVY